ncbi:MAG: NADH-quinone oxidoreductase subunit B family protein [Chloroflexota bacterium]
MAKVKIASDWLCGCAGCHMSLLDLDERLVALTEYIELASTPVTDLKRPHEVDVGILEGGIANTANVAVAKEMRAQCKVLISFGDCACFGGIPAMRNAMDKEECLRRGYIETESTVDGVIPDDPELATLLDKVQPVHEVAKVDFHLPGCPPPADAIYYALSELVAGRVPVLSGDNLRYD